MTLCCPRQQVVNRLREAGFTFNRPGERVDIYRKPGTALYINIPRRDLLPLVSVRTILFQAGLSLSQIESFLHVCDVSDSNPH